MEAETPDKLNNEDIDEEDDFETQQNLLGFFQLLLKVDMRVNPHLYKKQEPKKETKK